MLRPIAVKPWTPDEDDALVAMADLPIAAQARKLGRTYGMVSNRRNLLRNQGRIARRDSNHRWTEAETAIVRATLDQPVAVAYALLEDRGFGAVRFKREILRERESPSDQG